MSDHTHSHDCGCHSHSHHHAHHAGCGCQTHESHENCCAKHKNVKIGDISETELHFLRHLIECKFLPVARFVVKSSIEPDFENVALSPVFIIDTKDSMEEVKNAGNKLKNLEDLGLITLDYDIQLNGYAYDEYHNCDIFAYFKETVTEVEGKEGFLGDIPSMECGSIAPTENCIKLLANDSHLL